MVRTLILLALVLSAYGEGPTFEVASIKSAPLPGQGPIVVGCRGGPGTDDPGRWTCENMGLSMLVRSAFDIRIFQLQGISSGDDGRLNITAKIPGGATKEQFRQMQQNLIIERFGLKFHREKKEMQGYELVLAKNGPKFKEALPESPKDPAAESALAQSSPGLTAGKNGSIPPGWVLETGTLTSRRGQWVLATMENIAVFLSNQIHKPVTDSTGLKGKYDISLDWAPDTASQPPIPETTVSATSEPSSPSIFTAIQQQLGLKLQPKKVTVEILVIDHIEKTPTEN